MIRAALAISLLANLALAGTLYATLDDYTRLHAWACEMGNGGASCGED